MADDEFTEGFLQRLAPVSYDLHTSPPAESNRYYVDQSSAYYVDSGDDEYTYP